MKSTIRQWKEVKDELRISMLLGLSTPIGVEEPRLMKKDKVIHNKSVRLQEATQGLKDVYL